MTMVWTDEVEGYPPDLFDGGRLTTLEVWWSFCSRQGPVMEEAWERFAAKYDGIIHKTGGVVYARKDAKGKWGWRNYP